MNRGGRKKVMVSSNPCWPLCGPCPVNVVVYCLKLITQVQTWQRAVGMPSSWETCPWTHFELVLQSFLSFPIYPYSLPTAPAKNLRTSWVALCFQFYFLKWLTHLHLFILTDINLIQSFAIFLLDLLQLPDSYSICSPH